MDYYARKDGHHFVASNGFVKLSALDSAPTIVHVVFRKWPELTELRSTLESKLGSPVYLSTYYDTPHSEFDIYALAAPEAVLRALGSDDRVVRADVLRRQH